MTILALYGLILINYGIANCTNAFPFVLAVSLLTGTTIGLIGWEVLKK